MSEKGKMNCGDCKCDDCCDACCNCVRCLRAEYAEDDWEDCYMQCDRDEEEE